MRLLELPRDSTVPGPGQAAANITADPEVSEQLNILARGDSTVRRGNLLTLPVGGGLLYVQPVYVQAASGTTYPLLQRVLVSFGDEIGYAETLDEALDQVFGGDSGADAGDVGAEPVPDPGVDTPGGDAGSEPVPDDAGPIPTPSTPAPSAPAGDARTALDEALQRAQQAILDGQQALADNDFARYGEAQTRLDEAIRDAIEAEGRLGDG